MYKFQQNIQIVFITSAAQHTMTSMEKKTQARSKVHVGPLHITCPAWRSGYLQPRKKLLATAHLQNKSKWFSGHAAIPEAAHLHPDQRALEPNPVIISSHQHKQAAEITLQKHTTQRWTCQRQPFTSYYCIRLTHTLVSFQSKNESGTKTGHALASGRHEINKKCFKVQLKCKVT